MTDKYLESTLNILNAVRERERIVQGELDRIGPICKNTPLVPCCLLRTETEIIQRYLYTLEREVAYRESMEESKNADV